MDKNSILILILLSLFTVDVLKLHYYPEVTIENRVNSINSETEVKPKTINPDSLENLDEEDLKLDDIDSESPQEPSADQDLVQDSSSNNENKPNKVNKSVNKKNKKNAENKNKFKSGNDDLVKLTIRHCTSHKTFADDLRKELIGNYTNIDYTTEIYPASPTNQLLSKLLFGLQILIAVIAIGGSTIRQYLPFIPAKVFDFIESKKIMFGLFAYFTMSSIQTQLTQTGAFEIFVDEEIIFSKLATKKLPSSEEIVELLVNAGVKLIS